MILLIYGTVSLDRWGICSEDNNDCVLEKTVRFSEKSVTTYEVCSNSIRIGIVVVVHWVGCVCNQS